MYLSPPLDPLLVEAVWHLREIRRHHRVKGRAATMTGIVNEAVCEFVQRQDHNVCLRTINPKRKDKTNGRHPR